MRAVKHPGNCRLCGNFKSLTFEHVPPKQALNSSAVTVLPYKEVIKMITGEDGRLPWNTAGLKGKVQQKGSGGYYLCQDCNNSTGGWYMREYSSFAKTLHIMIQQEQLDIGNRYSFIIQNVFPLRLFKAIMTMFCDINNDCFGDENLRHYLLTKEECLLDTQKYSVYAYLVTSDMRRITGLAANVEVGEGALCEPILISEMASYPIGFALYIDKPSDYIPFGFDISSWSKYKYDEKSDIKIDNIPYITLNSQFPMDYRTKEEIIRCIEQNTRLQNN